MSDFDQRNQAFDYNPPSRGASGNGAIYFVGGLVVLFILAMLFMGGSGTLPEDGAAPIAAPIVDSAAPVLGD